MFGIHRLYKVIYHKPGKGQQVFTHEVFATSRRRARNHFLVNNPNADVICVIG